MNLESQLISAAQTFDAMKSLPREQLIRQALTAGVDIGAKWQAENLRHRKRNPWSNFFVPVAQEKAERGNGLKMKGAVR